MAGPGARHNFFYLFRKPILSLVCINHCCEHEAAS